MSTENLSPAELHVLSPVQSHGRLMAEETLAAVATQVLSAEKSYEHLTKDLDGFERIIDVLLKLGKVREAKIQQLEDTSLIESLIEECHAKLRRTLDREANGAPSYETNFQEWADEVESDIRAQDPMMLSFDSGSEGEEEEEKSDKSRSFRVRSREGSVSSKSAGTLLDLLKSNGRIKRKTDDDVAVHGKDDRFFCLTTSAWAFAVIGMMITIGFLAGDFWVAQRNVAIQISRSSPSPLELPAITICNDSPNVPPFFDYPTEEYPGLPVFGISKYVRSNRSAVTPEMQVSYPNTLPRAKDSPIEEAVVAGDGATFRSAPRGFDVLRESQTLYSVGAAGSFDSVTRKRTHGFYCFRVGRKQKELLHPLDANRSTGVSAPAVQINLFKSKLWGACRSRVLGYNPDIHSAFASELLLFSERLEEKGILDFNGQNHSVLGKTPYQLGVVYITDFYCNVYFFSGFFYPSLDNANISYRYNESLAGRWEKTGAGPYYSAYSWDVAAPVLIGPDIRALQNDTYVLDALRVYAEEAALVNDSGIVSPDTSVSILDSTQSSIYLFRRVNVGGKNKYEVKEGTGQAGKRSLTVVSSYQINVDFSTFETEKILTAATMSWPEFLTDVFEFVGLFTGICIFTLIVAPAHSLV